MRNRIIVEDEIVPLMLNKKNELNLLTLPYISNTNLFSLFLCIIIIGVPISCILLGYYIAIYLGPPASHFPSPGVIADMQTLNYSWYNSHNITIDFYSRLGNQMFQYASLYGIGKANGLLPLLGKNCLLLNIYSHLKAKVASDERPGKEYDFYHERKSNAFDQRTFSLNFMKNIRLDGFFQSWRYFDHVRSDIKKQFQFNDLVLSDVHSFIQQSIISSSSHLNQPIFISIHVRRGDFLQPNNIVKGYSVSDVAYIQRAMRYFEIKFESPVFIVSSDDIIWCVDNIKSNEANTSPLLFSPFHDSPERDMALLSLSNHSIVTGGSFGWWGAYLAGGQVVYDKNFPEPLSKLRDSFRLGDYYPAHWKGL